MTTSDHNTKLVWPKAPKYLIQEQQRINEEYKQNKLHQLKVNNAYVETKMADILGRHLYRIVCEYLLPTIDTDENMLNIFCQIKFTDFTLPAISIFSSTRKFNHILYPIVSSNNFKLLEEFIKHRVVEIECSKYSCYSTCLFKVATMTDEMLDYLISKRKDNEVICCNLHYAAEHRVYDDTDKFIKYSQYCHYLQSTILINKLAENFDADGFNKLLKFCNSDEWKDHYIARVINNDSVTFEKRITHLHENKLDLTRFQGSAGKEIIPNVHLLTDEERSSLLLDLVTCPENIEEMVKFPQWKELMHLQLSDILIRVSNRGSIYMADMIRLLVEIFLQQ